MTSTKPMTRDEERNLISFLANSEEVASLATARLAARVRERNVVLSTLTAELPSAEKTQQAAAAKAMQLRATLDKAKLAYERATWDFNEANMRSNSAHSTVEGLKAVAFRKARELADPRIEELISWVWGLGQVVRCQEVEIALQVRSSWGEWFVHRTPGRPADVLLDALAGLEAIERGLREMLAQPYDENLGANLQAKKLEAAAIASKVLPEATLNDAVERLDLTKLPLPGA